MRYKKIIKCRCCKSSLINKIIDFGKMSLSTSFTTKIDNKNNFVPLSLVYCSTCFLVQLEHNFEFKKIYNNSYGYQSGINKSMNNHLKGIVRQIEEKILLRNNDIILDIASNDGTLLKKYKNKNLIKIGIDPTIKKFKNLYEKNTLTSANFFNKKIFFKLSKKNKAKIITSIAVFYDVPDPSIFVKHIKDILHKEGIWILEQSYFPLLMKNNAYDSICHEHITYFMIHQINIILKNFNLRIFDASTNQMNGGSIRLFISREDSKFKNNIQNINAILKLEKKIIKFPESSFNTFKKNIIRSKNELIKLINKIKLKNYTIHIYGASTKGNVILQYCNIDNKIIKYASDRNPDKIGKITPGTNITIISEKESRKLKPDYYLVMPWHFKDEFMKREKNFLNKGGKFIFPLPKINII